MSSIWEHQHKRVHFLDGFEPGVAHMTFERQHQRMSDRLRTSMLQLNVFTARAQVAELEGENQGTPATWMTPGTRTLQPDSKLVVHEHAH
jgi:hypothetical protein